MVQALTTVPPFMLAMAIAMFNQLSGINAVSFGYSRSCPKQRAFHLNRYRKNWGSNSRGTKISVPMVNGITL
ncbi:MAG: hypothetical protein A2268_10840 [Candidatus Raymondbacteria bacterium RifOxyA12_full_50_37]|uniref:Uncharacterized protein n=1 Tax=Candidatus Raymondbacteria bacterium RIFOXYD12_FULL_49_13 TaxID=1817890 RepID=A0A1F7FL78_UNCRA|nr:MAG: hypothetical protein A2268_10840 [Candidatus Raymondbacteria bacterium RifOxyA12_full_50_37]OGJ85458.1 MAG: hypothetical protein A2248_12625 [Candidatus Raymondbacteria bacterium RIFOXYA2_FULL_49_16]OGJ94966.1 MAG: hypothetical protein A2453_08095 [Candidatus Raymondbacteria bacterium RIFOXYC2_FULL_50_21]OGK01889.1 MAG: hypothetical protein A2487_11750 [Candidatus Raymondbacteria bacterium RifOxyC12_full_50_8]OGK07351.1 MAG: hypothetical protein A2519_07395 [Candidatus Raymondbacteria b